MQKVYYFFYQFYVTGGRSLRSGEDDSYDEMDLIFRGKPRNADSSPDDDFGVKNQKRRRSKPDQYLDPFQKTNKRPKYATHGWNGNYGSPRAILLSVTKQRKSKTRCF